MDNPNTNEGFIGKNVFLIINQQIIPISKEVTRLGRQLDNDLVFKEQSVSRNHAEIRFENGKYILVDLQSSSGTYVNSSRIERCVLNSGDLIALANVQFMFVNNIRRITNASVITTRSLPPLPPEGDNSDGQ